MTITHAAHPTPMQLTTYKRPYEPISTSRPLEPYVGSGARHGQPGTAAPCSQIEKQKSRTRVHLVSLRQRDSSKTSRIIAAKVFAGNAVAPGVRFLLPLRHALPLKQAV